MLSGSPLEIRKATAPSCEVPKSFRLWLLHGRRYKLWSWFKKKNGTLKNVNLLLSCNAQLPRNLQQYPVTLALLSEHSLGCLTVPWTQRVWSWTHSSLFFLLYFYVFISHPTIPAKYQQKIIASHHLSWPATKFSLCLYCCPLWAFLSLYLSN